ncbi:unnamed protein product [Lymnaea stagnalis]|uniref:Uncharacterized protein n=1 Tax=Lymnaea stagnalis TaxID=6523 RepID=A0AAV2HPK3_LYMST
MTKEQIEERLSELFANINEKRNHDLKLLTQLKQEIMTQAERSCERLERHMCHMHEAKGKELDDAVNKLLGVLDRIRALETELDSSKSSLNILCQDIHIPM